MKKSLNQILLCLIIYLIIKYGLEYLYMELIFAVISIILSTTIHEFGHFVFGKMFGYKLVRLNILFLNWKYVNSKLKFSLGFKKGFYGFVGMIPTKNSKSINKNIWFYLGGIIFNLITGILFYMIGFRTNNVLLESFMNILGGFSILSVLINFLPILTNNNPTDGKLFWSYILKKPYAKDHIARINISEQLIYGIRPKDVIFEKEETTDPTMIYYKYLQALDANDQQKVDLYIALIEISIPKTPSINLTSVYYELCFINSIHNHDGKAFTYYQKCKKGLEKDIDINGFRIKAYFAYYFSKSKDIALEYCEKGLEVKDKYPYQGIAIMEANLINSLKDIIKNS